MDNSFNKLFSKSFNKSFNDLSFIQNVNIDNMKIIFVFDFDLTLTNHSSNGINKEDASYIELFDSQDKLDKLKFYLTKITNSNNYNYVNTRGLISDINYILNSVGIEVGENKLIKDIKGSNNLEIIESPFTESELIAYNLNNVANTEILWSIKKVLFLNEIKKFENSPLANIFFFDDSIININTAKMNGYMNSFLIGSNDSGIHGLDYLLIKLYQIINILGY